MNNQILKKRPIIISAWICAGKTYMTNKYDNVTELPSGDYKYILTEDKLNDFGGENGYFEDFLGRGDFWEEIFWRGIFWIFLEWNFWIFWI